MSLTFAQVLHAWQIQDPTLVDKLCTLALQPDPVPNQPIPDEELTFEKFLQKIFSDQFREQPEEVQFAQRIGMIAKLESEQGNYPLPARYKIHIILTALWEDGSTYSREILKQAIAHLPLDYGIWKGLKRIYKEAEYNQDYEIFGQITAKIDLYRFDKTSRTPVSLSTKSYMSLRAWRYLRTLGQQMPTAYIDAVVHVLANYSPDMTADSPSRAQSWVLNHICFHNSLNYDINRFQKRSKRKLFDAKGRAFGELWQRDYKPLITLLATAKNEAIRQFATDSLKHDFKTALRDVDVETIHYLSSGFDRSVARDEMIVWLLEQSPNFEKSKFGDLGLHDVVMTLLYSDYADAYKYAISYAKSYAPNIPVSELMFLAVSEYDLVRTFAIEQILNRDPIKDIGLHGWGQLLDTEYHHEVSSKQLAKYFAKKDLTPDWFFKRLISGNAYSVDFAIKQLPNLYSPKELGSNYFISMAYILDDYSRRGDSYYGGCFEQHLNNEKTIAFALQQVSRLNLNEIDKRHWQFLLLYPFTQAMIIKWIEEERINVSKLPMSYLHALAYEPDWQVNDFIYKLKNDLLEYPQNANLSSMSQESLGEHHVKSWQQKLDFDDDLALTVRSWLSDVRRFAPTELGFEWLMALAQSEHWIYRDFAISRINKGFLPADFVNYNKSSNSDDSSDDSKDNPTSSNNTLNIATEVDNKVSNDTEEAEHVDLNGQRFLFTGKMQSMTRGEAEKLVKAANGLINGAVNGKLDYLVIGDEGSALYGNGRKGSKQVKAEALIKSGATLKIISETAFLQMLTGQDREVSEDETLKGSESLWHMAIDDPNAPISELALSYLTHHHEQICMALTDRPVDPDAVIPSEFFSAERIVPLLSHTNTKLRGFALLVAEYELANWHPTPTLWVQMAQSPFKDVTDLLKRALLDAPSAENRRYHVNAEQYNEAMLQALIASSHRFARHIGITLLQRHPNFQNVDTLYRLTQSTQREVRYAAVTMLWQRYKANKTSPNWTPSVSEFNNPINPSKTTTQKEHATINSQQTSSTMIETEIRRSPEHLVNDVPADLDQLLVLLRQGLFELPPGRLSGSKDSNTASNSNTVDTGSSTVNGSNTVNKSKVIKGSPNQIATSDTSTLKVIPASRAKLALIETFRDVGLADKSFATLIIPLLYTFTHSAGKMERNACLVAVTRLLNRYPDLANCLISKSTTQTA